MPSEVFFEKENAFGSWFLVFIKTDLFISWTFLPLSINVNEWNRNIRTLESNGQAGSL